MKPYLSIIIPTYNRAALVLRAIRSILNQDYDNYEVIVIDDCSSDGTIEELENLNEQRIKIIKSDKNKGSQVSRNTGIQASQGEVICFLDSDDELSDYSLSKRIKYFLNDHNCQVLISGYYVSQTKRNGKINIIKKITLNEYKNGNVLVNVIQSLSLAPTSALMVRESCFDRIGLFDPSFVASQDDDIMIRLALEYNMTFIHEPLINLHLHRQRRISTNNKSYASGFYQLVIKHESTILSIGGKRLLIHHYAWISALLHRARIEDEKIILYDIGYQKDRYFIFPYIYYRIFFLLKSIYNKIVY